MKGKILKIAKIVANVLLYVLLIGCLFLLTVAIGSKKDTDGAATVFGKQIRLIRSSSMEECDGVDVSGFEIGSLPIKTMIIVETVPDDETQANAFYKSLKVGDVLTFRYVYTSQETITHRITAIEEKEEGGFLITLKGDNGASETATGEQIIDTSLTDSPNYVIGKVTGKSYLLGLIVYAMKTPVGIVCIVIVPCLIVIAMEIVRIVGAVNADKREKAKAEEEKKQTEIEELKRQLADLKKAVQENNENLQTTQGEEL